MAITGKMITDSRIEIEDLSEDKLKREVWTFWYNRLAEVTLSTYDKQERATTRHKWRCSKWGDTALYEAGAPRYRATEIKSGKDVPMPETVKQAVIDTVVAALRVTVRED